MDTSDEPTDDTAEEDEEPPLLLPCPLPALSPYAPPCPLQPLAPAARTARGVGMAGLSEPSRGGGSWRGGEAKGSRSSSEKEAPGNETDEAHEEPASSWARDGGRGGGASEKITGGGASSSGGGGSCECRRVGEGVIDGVIEGAGVPPTDDDTGSGGEASAGERRSCGRRA